MSKCWSAALASSRRVTGNAVARDAKAATATLTRTERRCMASRRWMIQREGLPQDNTAQLRTKSTAFWSMRFGRHFAKGCLRACSIPAPTHRRKPESLKAWKPESLQASKQKYCNKHGFEYRKYALLLFTDKGIREILMKF